MYSCSRAGLYLVLRCASFAVATLAASALGGCSNDDMKGGSESTIDPATVDGGAETGQIAPMMDAAVSTGGGFDPALPPVRPRIDASTRGPAAPVDASAGDSDGMRPGVSEVDAAAMNPSCGGPGQACCAGDRCSSGCCVSGLCLANGTSCGANAGTCMADACSGCGALGESCCPGRTCGGGAACGAGNTCVACGGENQRCCADSQCAAGSCIGAGGTSPGVCRLGCGAAGEMCCPSGGIDLPFVDTFLSNNGGICVGALSCLRGKCGSCGGEGEPCCPGTNSCGGTLQCIDSVCQKCGQPGQACCAPTALNLDGCAGPLNSCQNGACAGMNCGLLNEACCPSVVVNGAGSCSATGTICNESACRACGGLDQPCCTGANGARSCAVRGAVCTSGACKMP